MAIEFITTDTCPMCNGDGYISATKKEWADYLLWSADPTEDRANSHDNFPVFLKDLPNHSCAGFFKDKVTFPCSRCGGKKTIAKRLSLEELKKILG